MGMGAALSDATRSDGNTNLRAAAAPEPGSAEEKLQVDRAARVVEEVSLEKIGKEHVETCSDKVRRQQVEVDRLRLDGNPIPNPRQQPKASK